MNQAVKMLWCYLNDDRATTAIEYGLIAGIISLAIAMVALQIGVSLGTIFEEANVF